MSSTPISILTEIVRLSAPQDVDPVDAQALIAAYYDLAGILVLGETEGELLALEQAMDSPEAANRALPLFRRVVSRSLDRLKR